MLTIVMAAIWFIAVSTSTSALLSSAASALPHDNRARANARITKGINRKEAQLGSGSAQRTPIWTSDRK